MDPRKGRWLGLRKALCPEPEEAVSFTVGRSVLGGPGAHVAGEEARKLCGGFQFEASGSLHLAFRFLATSAST